MAHFVTNHPFRRSATVPRVELMLHKFPDSLLTVITQSFSLGAIFGQFEFWGKVIMGVVAVMSFGTQVLKWHRDRTITRRMTYLEDENARLRQMLRDFSRSRADYREGLEERLRQIEDRHPPSA